MIRKLVAGLLVYLALALLLASVWAPGLLLVAIPVAGGAYVALTPRRTV